MYILVRKIKEEWFFNFFILFDNINSCICINILRVGSISLPHDFILLPEVITSWYTSVAPRSHWIIMVEAPLKAIIKPSEGIKPTSQWSVGSVTHTQVPPVN
ncbi:unnamed protein product, partial [Meganyctiphanes norvegica]